MFHFTVTFMKFEILYHQLAIFLDLQQLADNQLPLDQLCNQNY